MLPDDQISQAASEPLSRRLYIGLGDYGARVAQQIRQRLAAEPSEATQRTRVLSFQPGQSPFEPFDAALRRTTRQSFLESGVCGAVFEEIEAAVTFCARMPSALDSTLDRDATIYIFLIADLAETFAGGLFLDIAALARIAASGRPVYVLGLFGLGLFLNDADRTSYVQRRAGFSNCCAAMRELDYVLAHRCEELFRFSEPVPVATIGHLYDQCFLLTDAGPQGTLAGLAEHASFVRRFVYRLGHGTFLQRLSSFPQEVSSTNQAPDRPLYSGVGLSCAYLPRRDIYAYCMNRWAQDVAQTLSSARATPSSATASAPDEVRCTLPDSTETLSELLAQHASPLPEAVLPADLPSTRHEAAQIVLKLLDELQRATQPHKLPAALEELANSRFVRPFRSACQRQIDTLVEGRPAGIAAAFALLDRLYTADLDEKTPQPLPDLNALLKSAARQVETEKERTASRLDLCRQRLGQILSTPPDEPPPTRPFWLWHPIRYWQVRQQERDFYGWVQTWLDELHDLRQSLRSLQIAAHVQRVLRALAEVAEQERQVVRDLIARLQAAVAEIDRRYEPQVSPPLSVDRPVMPREASKREECYQTLYDDCIRQAGFANFEEALERLVVQDRLLVGFRSVTAERVAAALEEIGRAHFARVGSLDLDHVLSDARFRRYALSLSELTSGLWERAAPFIDTAGAILAPGWQIAQLAGFWLPAAPCADALKTQVQADGHSAEPCRGSPTSLHVCRVIHGFTLDMIALLRVYVTSYDSEPDKHALHLFDKIDDLPLLPPAR